MGAVTQTMKLLDVLCLALIVTESSRAYEAGAADQIIPEHIEHAELMELETNSNAEPLLEDFGAARAHIKLLQQNGHSDSQCIAVINASIQTIVETVASDQREMTRHANSSSCASLGQAAVHTASQTLAAANASYTDATATLASAQSAPVTYTIAYNQLSAESNCAAGSALLDSAAVHEAAAAITQAQQAVTSTQSHRQDAETSYAAAVADAERRAHECYCNIRQNILTKRERFNARIHADSLATWVRSHRELCLLNQGDELVQLEAKQPSSSSHSSSSSSSSSSCDVPPLPTVVTPPLSPEVAACSPTGAPTSVPTAGPTQAPSTNPTDAPTPYPTNNPTDAPTTNPTFGPALTETSGNCVVQNNCAFSPGYLSNQNYANNEACSITINNPGSLSYVGFATEACCDHLTVSGVPAYSGSQGPTNLDVSAGQTINWRSDVSVVNTGWHICWSAN